MILKFTVHLYGICTFNYLNWFVTTHAHEFFFQFKLYNLTLNSSNSILNNINIWFNIASDIIFNFNIGCVFSFLYNSSVCKISVIPNPVYEKYCYNSYNSKDEYT